MLYISVSQKIHNETEHITHATISRTDHCSFALVILIHTFFRMTPLSVVATLNVCAAPPLRIPAIDSLDRSWLESNETTVVPLGAIETSRPFSTIVGRRDRGMVSSEPGIFVAIDCCTVPRSFMSFRYAMTERRALMYASRALSFFAPQKLLVIDDRTGGPYPCFRIVVVCGCHTRERTMTALG